MSKDLDFDFNKEMAKKTPSAPADKSSSSTKQETNTSQPLGISVAIEPEDGKYVFKDLAECSGEEFLLWASRVFPVLEVEKANPRDFDTRSSKSKAFEQILRFHTNSIFHVRKDGKALLH